MMTGTTARQGPLAFAGWPGWKAAWPPGYWSGIAYQFGTGGDRSDPRPVRRAARGREGRYLLSSTLAQKVCGLPAALAGSRSRHPYQLDQSGWKMAG